MWGLQEMEDFKKQFVVTFGFSCKVKPVCISSDCGGYTYMYKTLSLLTQYSILRKETLVVVIFGI